MAKATVRLGREGYRTEIKVGNHTIYADEPLDSGGTDTGPTPMQMMVGALGACIAITARLYAERKGWPLEGVDVGLDMERYSAKEYAGYEGSAAFIHEVRNHIVFRGPLSDEQRQRLMDIATKCPVHRALENPAFFVDVEDLLEVETLSEE
ncbi:MAG: OsmC family protein [Anaerolineae bacterium]|nr:OsmC family protein [Anaerolineae bacterium]